MLEMRDFSFLYAMLDSLIMTDLSALKRKHNALKVIKLKKCWLASSVQRVTEKESNVSNK